MSYKQTNPTNNNNNLSLELFPIQKLIELKNEYLYPIPQRKQNSQTCTYM